MGIYIYIGFKNLRKTAEERYKKYLQVIPRKDMEDFSKASHSKPTR